LLNKHEELFCRLRRRGTLRPKLLRFGPSSFPEVKSKVHAELVKIELKLASPRAIRAGSSALQAVATSSTFAFFKRHVTFATALLHYASMQSDTSEQNRKRTREIALSSVPFSHEFPLLREEGRTIGILEQIGSRLFIGKLLTLNAEEPRREKRGSLLAYTKARRIAPVQEKRKEGKKKTKKETRRSALRNRMRDFGASSSEDATPIAATEL